MGEEGPDRRAVKGTRSRAAAASVTSPGIHVLKKQQLKLDPGSLKCCFSSMIKSSNSPRWTSAALIPTAALVLLMLPGCERFRRVPKPVTTSPGQHPGMVQPPGRPVPPPPQPEPEPKPEPEPQPAPAPQPTPGPRPTAIAVPGKPGFVFSPYNNKVIDVQGFRSGALVADPTYPMSERKFFRVP
jgi:hypothetical protein